MLPTATRCAIGLLACSLLAACDGTAPQGPETSDGATTEVEHAPAATGSNPDQDPDEENIFLGRCLLEVNGKKYIDGQCPINMESDGSFSIGAAESVPPGYFAMVLIVSKGVAEGYWNEDEGANHAHSPLGELKYSGGCWTNETAKVCAWK